MRPSLLLNHSFLAEVAFSPIASAKNVQRVLAELGETLSRTKRVRGEATLYVHPGFSTFDVGGGVVFVSWAQASLRSGEWGDILQSLLQLGAGPFIHDLTVDEGDPPSDSDPSCRSAPDWLQEITLRAGHHAWVNPGRAWIVSFGPCHILTSSILRFHRNEASVEVYNLRSGAEARQAEAALGKAATRTTREVLDQAVLHATRVVALDSARKAADRWVLDCDPGRLFDAIVGLDVYAEALDSGQPREVAAATYQAATSIEMSSEKGNTLSKPTLKMERVFTLPDGTKQLFEMHAKPGARTRVHVFTRREPVDPATPEITKSRVYIGHCGEHLRLR